MKVYCRLSKVQFNIPSQFPTLQLEAEHPIFTAPQPMLVAKAKDFMEGKLSDTEQRLLFLALLKSTGLVIFQCAAEPSVKIVAQNMPALLQTIEWHIRYRNRFPLPSYVIGQATKQLTYINEYIKMWDEEKETYLQRTAKKQLVMRAEEIEDKVLTYLHSWNKDPDTYAKHMIKWAMDASGLPDKTTYDKQIRDDWATAFCIRERDLAIYDASTDDLDAMITWFEQFLDATQNPILVPAVLKRARRRLRQASDGILADLTGGQDYALLDDDDDVVSSGSSPTPIDLYDEIAKIRAPRIIRIDGVQANINKTLAAAPIEKPEKTAYLAAGRSLGEWLRDHARWSFAQQHKAEQEARLKLAGNPNQLTVKLSELE